MHASDAEMLRDGPARPSPTVTNTKDTFEEEIDESDTETESEDEDPEDAKKYWEVKWKTDGVHEVV